VKTSSLVSRPDSLVCPLCEVDQLRPSGNDSAQCASCAGLVSGAMLVTLRRISALPDALGSHACEECGHPEMQRLPDGTYHCPSCGSEVLLIGTPPIAWKADECLYPTQGGKS
jgi:ribosomal protein L37AE/L43A